VALAATGDELVPVDAVPGGAQIRNSNTNALHAQGLRAGAEVVILDRVADDPARIAETAARGFDSDLLVLTGGVSAGAFDLVEDTLASLGVEWLFARVAIKPGAPLAFGVRGPLLVFGLPGNPVSAQVTFELFVRPALLKMQGARTLSRPMLEAELRGPVKNHSGRRAYIPARVGHDGSRLTVHPLKSAGSADLFAHAGATGLLLLEPGERSREAGDPVRVVLLEGFLSGGP
jgi:molybdopterin molybdotransferase